VAVIYCFDTAARRDFRGPPSQHLSILVCGECWERRNAMQRLDKLGWVKDLHTPTAAGRHNIDGASVVVTTGDIDRAKAELKKGLDEIVFNLVLISPAQHDAHYILGSIA
jgi:hypothetical protein